MSGDKDEVRYRINDWLADNFPDLTLDQRDDAVHLLADYLEEVLGG